MIERNLERLSEDEQSVLEAASVAGAEFSAVAVAAALERSVAEIEACCTKLSRREQFVGTASVTNWPDGTVAGNVRFLHALYRDVLYERVPPGHRIELHRRIAQREETAYGERTSEIASELAHHYIRCGDKPKAIKYLEIAGGRAIDRRAYTEAEQHYRNALALLQTVPESSERDKRELRLQVAFGRVMQWTHGWSADQTVEAYSRARLVVERSGSADSINILAGLCSGANLRGEPRAALALADQMLVIARGVGQPAALATALSAQGYIHYLLGDLADARQYLLEALEHYRAGDSRAPGCPGTRSCFPR
jgi:predicted ATPase